MLAFAAIVPAMSLGTNTPPEPKKVIVCKYVGTPGVDETLQTGNNPISVSENAIPGFTGSFPYSFADGQGRSVAIRYAANNQDGGSLSECEVPNNPPHDECPLIDGNQPEGTDCTPEEPPCTVNCEPPPVVDDPPVNRCPAGEGPWDGKDGDESEPGHNDECCPDTNNNQICDYKEGTPSTTTTTPTPVVVPSATTSTPTTTTPTSTTPAAAKPKAKAKPAVKVVLAKKKTVTPKPTNHVCTTLKDGTERRWYSGGNGLKPGCYAIVRGAG